MNNQKLWQFFLQKKDNSSWQKISKPTSLDEGVYRIIAQSGTPEIEVKIRITYKTKKNNQVLSRSQNFVRRTNHQGILIVKSPQFLGVKFSPLS